MKRVVLLPRRSGEPAEYLLLEEDGRVLERGALTEAASEPPAPCETIAVAPGAEILTRWLELPARTQAQAAAAASLMLRQELAADRDAHIALGRRGEDDWRLVVVAEGARMQGWLAQCEALGFRPDVLTPDHLTPPVLADEGVAALRFGDQLALRGPRLALTCEAELAPVILADRPFQVLERPEEIEAAFVALALNPPINLLQGPYAAKRSGGPIGWRTLAVALAAAAVAGVLPGAVKAGRYTLTALRIEGQVARAVAQLAPAEAGADPTAVLRRIEAGAGGAGATGFGVMAAALFSAVERAPSAKLNSLVYGPDGALRLSLSADSYEEIEAVRAALGEQGFLLEEGGSVNEAGGVVADLLVRPLA